MRVFWKRGLILIVVLAVIALGVAAGFMWLKATTFREVDANNPISRVIEVAPQVTDVVVLGGSRALPLGFAGIREFIENNTGRKVTVLAMDGNGVLPNALLLDILMRKTRPNTVVLAVDTFAFLSPKWNEAKLDDANLYARAPLDDDIQAALEQDPVTRDKVTAYRFGLGGEETEAIPDREMRGPVSPVDFERIYQPDELTDMQRIRDLYGDIRPELIGGYIERLEAMAQSVRATGGEFLLLLMPVPQRYTAMLPEAHYAVLERIRAVAQRHGLCLLDHTDSLPGDENYYDTDHLNRIGAERYASGLFAEVLLVPQGDDDGIGDVRLCGIASDLEPLDQ